jgi:HPt (histidine-containing phosphotransfer) domain-containing protein
MGHARGPTLAPSQSAAEALQERFLRHRERDLEAVIAAMQCGDYETIGRVGHNMRGNGTSYGHPDISAIGERLETAGDLKDLGRVAGQLALLAAWIERSRSAQGAR